MQTKRNFVGAKTSRPPLAVGRWPLAVGRWPLAVALIAGGLWMQVPEAKAQPASMAPGEVRFIIGGSGTRSGQTPTYPTPDNTFGPTWTSGTIMGPPIYVINTFSGFQKQSMLFSRYSSAALASRTEAASTSGTMKIMAAYRLMPGQPKPDTISAKVTTSAGASPPSGGPYTITTLDAKVNDTKAVPGSGSASATTLVTFDFKNASLATGESDIYVAYANGGTGSANVAFQAPLGTEFMTPANVGVGATAQRDTRSVRLSRGGRYERSELKDGDWHTYGDSIYSAWNPTLTTDSCLVPISISANYSGGWHTRAGGFASLFLVWDVTPNWSLSGMSNSSTDANGANGYTYLGTPTVQTVWLPTQWVYKGSATGAKTFDTSYTATDNGDQAKATAYYHLTLHDPVEQVGTNTPTIITLYAPLENADGIVGWFGYRAVRDPKVPKGTIKIGTSSVTGYSLKGTVDLDAFEGLLGFSAEAKQESTKTVDVEMETDIPEIPADKFGYIEVIHTFQRRHSHFYAYDASGKIRNMVGPDGAQVEMPHEAFQDERLQPDFHWKFVPKLGFDTNNLRRDVLPEPVFDSQRGRA